MTWRARLKGDSIDFDTLGRLFRDGDPTVGADDDGFYLTSTSFDDTDDVGEVHERAACLVCEVNGIARVLDHSYRNVELAGHYINDDGHKSVFVEDVTVTGRAQVTAIVTGAQSSPPAPPPGEQYVALARTDPHVGEAVSEVASDLDPRRIRRAYDVIKDDVGGEDALVALGWASSRKHLSRFRAPLIRAELSGDDALHLRSKGDIVSNPMDLSEARGFLLDLLHKWMDWKLQQG